MVVRKTAARKPAAKKQTAGAGRKATETGAVKKTAVKKAVAKKTVTATGQAAAEKTAVKKTAGKKSATKRAAATTAAAGTSAPAKRAAPARKAAAAKKQTGASKVAAKKSAAGTAASAGSAVPAARAAGETGSLAVLPGEEPWTPEEVAEARTELLTEVERLKSEIAASEDAVAGLLRDSGDGSGDEADTGSKNITREYEMALAANTREMLVQATHALQRLDEGTYGRCESCGNPIGKARMQAFPRATLCLDCKQRQERR